MIAHYEAESQYKLQSSDDATTTPFSLRRLNERPDGVESGIAGFLLAECLLSGVQETRANKVFFVHGFISCLSISNTKILVHTYLPTYRLKEIKNGLKIKLIWKYFET